MNAKAEPILELDVEIHSPREISRSRTSRSVFVDRLLRGFHHIGMGGQTQIIVGTRHYDLSSFDHDNRSLVLLKRVKVRIKPLLLDLVSQRIIVALLE